MPAFSAFNALAGGVIEVGGGASGGKDWTERANPKDFRLLGVGFDGTTWCAVGGPDGTDGYIVTATDPTGTWTERANPQNTFINGVIFAESLWVAVGNAVGGDGYIITSTNATGTWTQRTSPEDNRLSNITYGNGLFVAVGNAFGGDPYAIWSLNGTTSWTRGDASSVAGTDLLRDVAYGAGVFCAVGNTLCMSSADNGQTWTDRTSNIPNSSASMESIIWDGSQFVALGGAGKVWTSSNGTTSWTELVTTGDYTTSSHQGTSIKYDGVGKYVISGADPTDGQMWYSSDLIAWSFADSGIDADLNNMLDVHFANDIWVAVGLNGTDGGDAGILTAA